MKTDPSKEATDAAFAAHERDQILYIAKHTSFDQRIKWLEQALDLARSVYRDREKKGQKTIFY